MKGGARKQRRGGAVAPNLLETCWCWTTVAFLFVVFVDFVDFFRCNAVLFVRCAANGTFDGMLRQTSRRELTRLYTLFGKGESLFSVFSHSEGFS